MLAGYLAGKDLLLVLDNCEHVLTAVVEAVEPVLRGSPGLKVLATSRESLGIGGESVFHVPSLALPDDTEHAAESDAVKLFLDRVHSTRPDFDPTSEDLVHIVRICRRLDGIPLGLELAAARLRTLGTGQLADRLESSFRILTSGQKGGLPRQQTLTAAIEWSFDLLDPREQAVFRRLALFAGGFDLEAAEAVCAGGDIEAWETLDLLDQLVDKSLVEVAHGSSGVARYRLFEPIREYASGLLVISDPDGSAALAHAHYFAGLARLAEPHIRGPDQVRWAKRLDVEYDNLRAAFRTLSDNGDADAYLAMCFDLGFYWQHDGLNHEGIDTVLAMVDHPGADRRGAVKAWWVAAMLGFDVGDPSSIEQAEQGLAIATEIGDPNAVAWMKLVLGAACRTLPITRPDSAAHVREGYDSYRSHPEPPWFDRRWDEAIMEMYLGSYGPAGPDRQERYRKAIDGFREAGDLAMTATALFVTQFLAGEADEEWIFSSLTEAVEISRRTGYRAALGHSLYGWGARARARGELDGARSALSEAAQMLVEIGDTYCSAGALVEKVAADVRLGRIEEARSTLAEATRALLALSSPAPRLATQAEAYAAAMALRMGDTERAARYVRGLDELSDDTYFAPFALEFVSHREELAAAMSPAELERHSAGAALLTAGDLLADIHEWAANT